MKAWTAVLFDNDDNKYREIAIRVLVSLLRTYTFYFSQESVDRIEKNCSHFDRCSNYPMIVRLERDFTLIEVARVSTVRSKSLDFPSSRFEFVVWEVQLLICCVTRRATYIGIPHKLRR